MKLSLVVLFTTFTLVSHAQIIIPTDAKKYMGDVVTVCGQVSSAQKSNDIDLHPTLLGFGQGFPNNNFSVVILEEDLEGFNYNPVDLDKTNVCVTGMVVKIFGKPGIFVSDPSQIESSGEGESNLTYHLDSGN